VVSAGDFEESEGGVVAAAAAPVEGAATVLGAGVGAALSAAKTAGGVTEDAA